MAGLTQDEQKRIAGEKAAEYVRDGMVLGLGTGSSVEHTFRVLAQRMRDGLRFSGVPTSARTERIARGLGLPLVPEPAEVSAIDLTIDGADEADENGTLIKGGGGALTREKIVAAMSHTVIIVVDSSKISPQIGSFPLPVEVLPFGWRAAAAAIAALGAGSVRQRIENGKPVRTDNGNFVLDCRFDRIDDAKALECALNCIPGVIENGLFCGLCHRLIIGLADGSIRQLTPAGR